MGHVSLATGAARLLADDLARAVEDLSDAIEVFRAEYDHLGLILAVSRLGEAAWRVGDIDLFTSTHAELLDLGRSSRSSGVVTGATARLALSSLHRGELDEAKALADRALSSSSDIFMPVVNGYAFRSAGLVNLALGHADEGRSHLHQAIDAFERGTGKLGTGQAALCWIDVSRSHRAADEMDDTSRAATIAFDLAQASGDPWVQREARAHLALIGG
jgi:tetratricopeptide (TPR) repeat protein